MRKNDYGRMGTFKGYKVLGWFADSQKKWYQAEASKIRGGNIVEVGVYGGLSLLSIADICQANDTKLIGIDPWEIITTMNGEKLSAAKLTEWQAVFRNCRTNLQKIIQELGYDIELRQELSPQAADKFADGTLDLVFIDGDHATESVYNDLRAWTPKVKKNGLISGHDLHWASVRPAIERYCKQLNITYTEPVRNIWKIVK